MDSYLKNVNETNDIYYSKKKINGMNWEPRNDKEIDKGTEFSLFKFWNNFGSIFIPRQMVFRSKEKNIKSLQIANRNDYFDLVSWLS
jgi:hypothetical protein